MKSFLSHLRTLPSVIFNCQAMKLVSLLGDISAGDERSEFLNNLRFHYFRSTQRAKAFICSVKTLREDRFNKAVCGPTTFFKIQFSSFAISKRLSLPISCFSSDDKPGRSRLYLLPCQSKAKYPPTGTCLIPPFSFLGSQGQKVVRTDELELEGLS